MSKAVKNPAAKQLAKRIYHALKLTPADGTGLDKHAVWDMQQLMQVLNPHDDLLPIEALAIATILACANERRLRRGNFRPRPGIGARPPGAELLPRLHAV